MKRLPDSTKEAFDLGNLTVKKTSRVFSAMGIHQAHEQNNRAVKIDGGAIDIMTKESALLEWEYVSLQMPVLQTIIRYKIIRKGVSLKTN